MTICIAQVFTQCGFSGCSVVVWVQPGAVSAGLQQAAADWEKQVKSCGSLCCYKRKRKKSPLQFGLNWCFETNSQIRQRLAAKFNQGVSAITHLLDRWTTNQTYLKSRSKLYIHYKWELELGNYSFFFLLSQTLKRWYGREIEKRWSADAAWQRRLRETLFRRSILCVCLRFNRCG